MRKKKSARKEMASWTKLCETLFSGKLKVCLSRKLRNDDDCVSASSLSPEVGKSFPFHANTLILT